MVVETVEATGSGSVAVRLPTRRVEGVLVTIFFVHLLSIRHFMLKQVHVPIHVYGM